MYDSEAVVSHLLRLRWPRRAFRRDFWRTRTSAFHVSEAESIARPNLQIRSPCTILPPYVSPPFILLAFLKVSPIPNGFQHGTPSIFESAFSYKYANEVDA